MPALPAARSRLELDPDIPVCWEDPETLRWGFERPVVRLRHPTGAQQRLISALGHGIDPERLSVEALLAGISVSDARTLVRALEPVLRHHPVGAATPAGAPAPQVHAPDATLHAVICQGAHRVPALSSALTTCGLEVRELEGADPLAWLTESRDGLGAHPSVQGSPPPDPLVARAAPDLAVVVERYWDPLARTAQWLMADVPHLIVRFSDAAVFVGPLIALGRGPCHSCLSLARIEQDPATAALAAQLAGSMVASEQSGLSFEAAAHTADYVDRWRRADPSVHTTRTRISAGSTLRDVQISVETLAPHPECACTGAGAPPSESGAPDHRPAAIIPASLMNREGCRGARPPPETPDKRSTSRARVNAT